MDLDMYKHPTTLANLTSIKSFGVTIIDAESGELASGLIGEGRMAEPETILKHIQKFFTASLPLSGKKVLVNAGPTYEAIDPVRFIGNRSTGKMGIAIANEFEKKGASVTLILGPSSEKTENKNIHLIRVESSDDMYQACDKAFEQADIAVLSAAVADYKPSIVSDSKIKKKDSEFKLELTKTTDILESLGKKKTHQILVGFALETNNVIEYAKEKLRRKNLDFIVANSATESGAGFGVDTNKITLIDKHNKIHNFELKSKQEVAKDIVNFTITLLS
jgi:phosphopantothenoylcysteine decarboxylase/phosphopantothenate--cysteine ligase